MKRHVYMSLFYGCVLLAATISAQGQAARDTLQAANRITEAVEASQQKNYEETANLFIEAGEIFLDNGYLERAIFCYTNSGYALSNMYAHDRAVEVMLEVVNQYEADLDPSHPTTFGIYWQIAWGYFQLNNYKHALVFYTKAEDAMARCDNVSDIQRIKLPLDKGVVYLRISQYDMARKYMDKVSAFSYLEAYDNYAANVTNNYGIIYKNLGEYDRALDYYQRALYRAMSEYDVIGRHYVGLTPLFVNLASISLNKGEYDESIRYADRGIAIYYDFTPDWFPVLTVLKLAKGRALMKQGKNELAKEYILSAMLEAANANNPQFEDKKDAYMPLAQAYANLGVFDSAEYFANRFLEGRIGSLPTRNGVIPKIRLDIGEILAKKGDFEGALEQIQKGLIAMCNGFESLELKDNPGPEHPPVIKGDLLQLINHKARYLFEQGERMEDTHLLTMALATNQAAIDLFKEVRVNLLYQNSKLALAENSQEIFENGIQIAARLYSSDADQRYLEHVFYCMETNRAYLLEEARQVSRIEGFTMLPDSLVALETEVFTQIATLEQGLRNVIDSASAKELEDQLFDLNSTYEGLVSQRSTLVSTTGLGEEGGVGLPDIQQVLQADELFLEFFEGVEDMYVLAINDTGARLFNLGDAESLNSRISKFTSSIQQKSAGNYQVDGLEIYDRILGPVLTEFGRIRILHIVPDGLIGNLALDALPTAEKEVTSFLDIEYLVNNYSIRSHYAAALFASEEERQGADQVFVGFAPGFTNQASTLLATRSASDTLLVSELSALPGAESEVLAAAEIMKGEAIIGDKATETEFKRLIRDFDNVHIASHTLIDFENPLFSRLVFSIDSGGQDDGLLHIYELYGMQINSSLVNLSACNTGIGKTFKGEGAMSLAKGFMGAGARNLIMSLWLVSDQATQELMGNFYRKLKDGENGPEALRMAKLEYLENADERTAHPYYWSAFVFVGNGEEARGGINRLVLLGFTFLFVFLIVVRRRILSKKPV